VRCLALGAHSIYLLNIGRFDEARRFADQAHRAAPDAKTRSNALLMRGLINMFGGHAAEAVKDHAEATALARQLQDDPAFLAGALLLEAQALISAGSLNEAAALLDEARAVGSPADANALQYIDTVIGDLALADGRPADALEPYARSLERSSAASDMMQIRNDLFSVAEALAALGRETESLEVAGMAESHCTEIGATTDSSYDQHLATLEKRIGPAKAAELKHRGRAADPAERVAQVCQLARWRAPAHTIVHK
jgi:tetratricopeptide (TPR) repeat protein